MSAGSRPAGGRHDVLAELADGRVLYGAVADGFGAVADAYRANFVERADLGSGCTATVDGEIAVDLWGGVADARTGRQWTRDTAAVMFSCSKGVLAICAYLLRQDGRLILDKPVAGYWPEFAQSGKGTITVRQLMSHRAGLAAPAVDLTRADVIAWAPVVDALAAQRPHHAPDAGHVYHAHTYGWLVGEIIRRITGQRPGQFFASTVAGPLHLDTWLGRPSHARGRVAWMEAALPDESSDEARLAAELRDRVPVLRRSGDMGGAFAFPADEHGHVSFNDDDLQTAEMPAANGTSSAESLARLYAACVAPVDGDPLLTDASLDDALLVQSAGPQLTGLPDDGARWGTGFQLSSAPAQPMLGAHSFGHAGAGGQLAFADREHGVGFAYLSNQMGGYGDARANEITAALARALGA
jgi:CubicO group peptidase (beta-lactamase class C family)